MMCICVCLCIVFMFLFLLAEKCKSASLIQNHTPPSMIAVPRILIGKSSVDALFPTSNVLSRSISLIVKITWKLFHMTFSRSQITKVLNGTGIETSLFADGIPVEISRKIHPKYCKIETVINKVLV